MGNSFNDLLDLLEVYVELSVSGQILLSALNEWEDPAMLLDTYPPETLGLVNDFLEKIKPFVSDISRIEQLQSTLTYYLYYGQ